MRILKVRKRDGRVVPFQREKIADAIFRAAQSVGGEDRFLAEELAGVVVLHLERKAEPIPTIEAVQDAVEAILVETGHARTAKAYILYRERRAEMRARRPASPFPLIGGEGAGEVARRWSKTEVADRLVKREGLERAEAEEVARRVEDRVLASSHPRISTSLLGALVRSELFERGRTSSFGTTRRVGVPRERVRKWLRHDAGVGRAEDPSAFAEAIGEEVLASALLDDVLPRPVAEAHRRGDLHLYDLGAPLSLTSISLPAARVLEEEIGLRAPGRVDAARRAGEALAAIAGRHASFAARLVGIEDANVLLAPHLDPLDDEALAEELRSILLASAVAAFPGRAGRRFLEVGLSLEVPARLAKRGVPPPASEGVRYGDFADGALRVGRALLHEAAVLRRTGRVRGVLLTLSVPRGRPRDPAARAFLKQALSLAAESAEPVVVLEPEGEVLRGTRWLRVREGETPDPFRFEQGDSSVATATAVDVAACAFLTRGRGAEAAAAEMDRLVAWAVEGAAARRDLLRSRSEAPGGTLYALGRGSDPLVDVETAVHLIEPVGLAQAAEVLFPGEGALRREAWIRDASRRMRERASREAARQDLVVVVGLSPVREAADRMGRLDRARFPEAEALLHDGATYASARSPGTGVDREPIRPAPTGDGPWIERLRHRVEGGRAATADLLGTVEACEQDPWLEEVLIDPWPRRFVRS